MKQHKLCFVLPEYSHDTVSHFYHLYELLQRISQRADVYLVAMGGSHTSENNAMKNVYIATSRFPLIGSLKALIRLFKIRFKGCEIFYVHYSGLAAIMASVVTKIFGGTVYYWHCGPAKDFFVKGWKWNYTLMKRKIINDYQFILALKGIDYLVTGTNYMADYYHKHFGLDRDKIKIMPNWVNLERFSHDTYDKATMKMLLGLSPKRKVVLFVHRLAQRTGAHYLVEIARSIVKVCADVTFVIIGDGPYRSKLERKIAESQMGDAFRLLGAVPNRDIAAYYAMADVFIMPSEQEGFPRVLLEAMAMGVPFVASMPVGTLDEILTDIQKQFVVRVGDIAGFCARVLEILKDNSLREKLAETGWEIVRNYTRDMAVQRLLKIVASGGTG